MSNLKETILIVEDEEALGEGLCFNFEAEGYAVVWKKDGVEGLEYFAAHFQELSAVILDLMLPRLDGFEVLRRTRRLSEQVPIIVLSAKGMEMDKVRALELGADDYVTKPFSLMELILRVRGFARKRKWYRASQHDSDMVTIGKAILDTNKLILTAADGILHRISPTENSLIQAFLMNENRLMTRADLLKTVWNHEAGMETRTVDVYVSKLRKLIEENPAKPEFLISVRGVGYIYVTDSDVRSGLTGAK